MEIRNQKIFSEMPVKKVVFKIKIHKNHKKSKKYIEK